MKSDPFVESYDIIEQLRMSQLEDKPSPGDAVRNLQKSLRFQFLPHYCGMTPKWRVRMRSLHGERTIPDFACVGALKSGTSDLSTYLFQHSSMIAPLTKEIPSATVATWRPHYPTVGEKQKVAAATGHALSGYFKPWMHHVELIENYHAAKPDAKIILMVRNPTYRALSHYKWDLLVGGKETRSLPQYRTFADYVDFCVSLFPATRAPSMCGFPMLQSGIYAKSVQLWIDRFGRENTHVVTADEFFTDITGVVCGIHEFLGLTPEPPTLHEIVNQNPVTVPPPEPQTMQRLHEFYQPWNEQLYAILGRDLAWDVPSGH